MKTWDKANAAIHHGATGAWQLALGLSGLALVLAAGGGNGNATRWARSAATAWALTRHDGSSALDWVSLALGLAALACFAFRLKAVAHKTGAIGA
jgi:hypothetical protein